MIIYEKSYISLTSQDKLPLLHAKSISYDKQNQVDVSCCDWYIIKII
jgi:hypothetical protein